MSSTQLEALISALADRLTKQEEIYQDCLTLAYMMEIYCKAHHPNANEKLNTPGETLGFYRKAAHTIQLCPACQKHLRYAELRRVCCPHEQKPNCKDCSQHCYKKSEAEYQKEVMRYSGRRSLFYPYLWIEAYKHLYASLIKRASKKRTAHAKHNKKT